MVSRTIKNLVKVAVKNEMWDEIYMFLFVLCTYPNQKHFVTKSESKKSLLYDMVVDELDRQYARWKNGGVK